jgi:hypothetical protein
MAPLVHTGVEQLAQTGPPCCLRLSGHMPVLASGSCRKRFTVCSNRSWAGRPRHSSDRQNAQNARLKIYPDSAHGFLFQHYRRFAADAFLAEAG